MMLNNVLQEQIASDLGLNVRHFKGQNIQIRNCWHLFTNGSSVDYMFSDTKDFRYGMDLIYILSIEYDVVILAFVLMDTHVHFVLYGQYEECKAFLEDFVKRLSMYHSFQRGENKKLSSVEMKCEQVDTDYYLKTVICYVIKNPPVGGLPYLAWNYPWSSGSLYFAPSSIWTSAMWTNSLNKQVVSGGREIRERFKSRVSQEVKSALSKGVIQLDGFVFPGEYVAVDIVEQIFCTHKSFNYFMCVSKESEVEARGDKFSNLTIPIQELRQRKNELCQEMFSCRTIKQLSLEDRIKLSKALKFRYHSSVKQIVRICGLVYDDVKDLI